MLDVDGTLVDSERDGHRIAFNRAFEEAGLADRWDVERYGELLAVTGGERRLNAYFQEQGMPADERQHFASSLHRRKTEIFTEMASQGEIKPRPGVPEFLDELAGAAPSQAGQRATSDRSLVADNRRHGPGAVPHDAPMPDSSSAEPGVALRDG